MNQSNAATFCAFVLALPLAGSVLNALLGRLLGRRFVNLVGTVSILAALVVTLIAFSTILGAPQAERGVTTRLWEWINLGPNALQVGVDVTLDQLSILMLLVITGVGFLIHVYSVGYMAHDKSPHRFFAYMNFFIFAMEVLVLAANLVILIIGWALVALASYLLIGYYYERKSAVLAARKAFITQVIGDVALVIAAFLIVINVSGHTLSLPGIFNNADSLGNGSWLVTGICILLAIGAFAKSAQFPLHTWLPDAMEGPTPVSALIHAATMVTAGVYLIARFHPLFDRAPVAQGIVACVGMGTALMAGIIALSQVDIKRVIAYSTMSQIGLMIFAVGIGAYPAAMYHFATHAVFKALLFMAAGNVIHALRDEQDIRNMGGLAPRLKVTYFCFLAGSLALAGVVFAGMFSKEDLLGFGTVRGPGAPLLFLIGLAVNVLTSVYAFRLVSTVFWGEKQTALGFAAKEAPPTMLVPVAILAIGSALMGYLLQWPISVFGHQATAISDFLGPVFASHAVGSPNDVPGWLGLIAFIIGVVASLMGLGLVWMIWVKRSVDAAGWFHRPGLRVLPLLSYHRFYFDELYDALLVRPTRRLARAMRRVVEPRVMDGWVRGVGTTMTEFSTTFRGVQTGLIRDYASYMILGAGLFTVVTIIAASVGR
ncbi:MAG: NADH-quinone oxidoreductase subunit L [Candidatus Dormibacteria bacterium]